MCDSILRKLCPANQLSFSYSSHFLPIPISILSHSELLRYGEGEVLAVVFKFIGQN